MAPRLASVVHAALVAFVLVVTAQNSVAGAFGWWLWQLLCALPLRHGSQVLGWCGLVGGLRRAVPCSTRACRGVSLLLWPHPPYHPPLLTAMGGGW